MAFGNKDILGIAVEEQSLVICQLQSGGEGSRLVRRAVMAIPEDKTLEDAPEALGEALGRFLKKNKFSASRAVIGLPAGWLIMKDKVLPPADDRAALDMVRLAAEREFSTDARDLCVDCLLDATHGHARRALLVATLRKTVDAVKTVAQRAGLKVRSVTASLMALGEAADTGTDERQLMLRITPQSVELALRNQRRVAVVKHLATRGPGTDTPSADGTSAAPVDYDIWAQTLTNELRRVVASLPPANGDTRAPSLSVWDGAGLPATVTKALGDRLDVGTRQVGDFAALNLTGNGVLADADYPPGRYAAAAALALTGAQADSGVLVDFLNPQLAVKETVTLDKRRLGLIAGSAVVLLAILYAADVGWNAYVISDNDAYLATNRTQIDSASELNEKVRFARKWYDQRPDHVACLTALTKAFPPYEKVWTTSITLEDGGQVVITGKAIGQELVQDLANALRVSDEFEGVSQPFVKSSDPETDEFSFRIAFKFKPGAPG